MKIILDRHVGPFRMGEEIKAHHIVEIRVRSDDGTYWSAVEGWFHIESGHSFEAANIITTPQDGNLKALLGQEIKSLKVNFK